MPRGRPGRRSPRLAAPHGERRGRDDGRRRTSDVPDGHGCSTHHNSKRRSGRSADGRSSDDDLALFHADERASLVVLDRLIVDAEDDLASVRNLPGDERDLVVADLTDTLESLRATARDPASAAARTDAEPDDDDEADDEDLEPGEVQLQASWTDGQVVVWAAGRGTTPESNAELSARLGGDRRATARLADPSERRPARWDACRRAGDPDEGRARLARRRRRRPRP